MMKFKTEIKFAVYFFIVTLIWMAGERLVGLHSTHIDKHMYYTNLYAIPAVLVYVLALKEKRKLYNGMISYGQAFKAGLILTLFVTILSPLGQYITSTYITPHYFENAINYAVTNNKSTQEEAVAYFNLNNYLKQSVIGALVMGLVTTAIVSIFVRRSK